MTLQRHYVERITSVKPNKKTGMVKITFAINDEGKSENVTQLLVHAADLQEIMREIGETMQKTMGPGGPGGPRGPGPGPGKGKGGKGAPPLQSFKDLTKE
ncbi:MAG: hypothetical protein AAFO61_00400 [Pseudomonadota bacterium]